MSCNKCSDNEKYILSTLDKLSRGYTQLSKQVSKNGNGQGGGSGKSAYDVWLEAGNSGTYQDFINSLKGPRGDAGDSAYKVWLSLGNTGTAQDFINSLKGTSSNGGNDSVNIGTVSKTFVSDIQSAFTN